MTATIQARVDKGAALLDRERPGWDQRIDLDRLNVRSECNCVFGQEFAQHPEADNPIPFTTGAEELFGTEATADDLAEYGFEEYSDEPEDGGYEALTAEWKRVILARRIDRMTTAGAK